MWSGFEFLFKSVWSYCVLVVTFRLFFFDHTGQHGFKWSWQYFFLLLHTCLFGGTSCKGKGLYYHQFNGSEWPNAVEEICQESPEFLSRLMILKAKLRLRIGAIQKLRLYIFSLLDPLLSIFINYFLAMLTDRNIKIDCMKVKARVT